MLSSPVHQAVLVRELALHLLDIAENAVSAKANTIRIRICEDALDDRLTLAVEDNGSGMDAEMVARVVDPFVTSRTTRKVGLGIPLLKAAAESCNGGLAIHSVIGQGTRVEVTFQLSHIDRMPLGNLVDTLMTLIVGSPEVHWIIDYTVNDLTFLFDDQPVKEVLDGLPLSEPTVLAYLRASLRDGITSLHGQA